MLGDFGYWRGQRGCPNSALPARFQNPVGKRTARRPPNDRRSGPEPRRIAGVWGDARSSALLLAILPTGISSPKNSVSSPLDSALTQGKIKAMRFPKHCLRYIFTVQTPNYDTLGKARATRPTHEIDTVNSEAGPTSIEMCRQPAGPFI